MKYTVLVEFIAATTYTHGETKKYTYHKEYIPEMVNDRFGYIPAMHFDETPVTAIRTVKVDLTKALFDVIDFTTRYVIVRTFKDDINSFFKLAKSLGGIVLQDIKEEKFKRSFDSRVSEETGMVCTYTIGKSVIRSWRKYQIKEL